MSGRRDSSQRRLAFAALFAALAPLAGCLHLSSPPLSVRSYVLEYEPPAAAAGGRLPVVLSIPPLAVGAAYDSEAIVYRPGANRLGRYSYHRWATDPGSMVGGLLARDLAATDRYRAVQHGRSVLASDYRLAGEIEAIEERSVQTGCAAHLSLRLLLVRARAADRDPVVARASFSREKPCACANAAALSAALSSILKQISGELDDTVYRAIAADIGR